MILKLNPDFCSESSLCQLKPMLRYIVSYLPWFVFYLEWKSVRLELLTSIYNDLKRKFRDLQIILVYKIPQIGIQTHFTQTLTMKLD